MIICPYCGAENIQGADTCDGCGQPLADLHLPVPATDVERALLKDRVPVLSPNEPIVVTPDTSVASVLKTLVEKEIGCVFVVDPVDPRRIVGVFTERDALLRLSLDDDLGQRTISEVMTPNPQHLAETAKVAFAVRMMDLGGYRHVPVVDGEERVTGVISVRDILQYLTSRMTEQPA